ncbi:hypothetical protein [Sulfuriferula thiophila]|uniref:hypothetical protein n=1 Tax=Sulfuriferula thiophila TaxID=1781211 RepID=UPI000F60F69B|nr:hypothetical protein [Sulfuriferula thiophila]
MLPLWRDQLRIGVSPHAIVLARIGKGLRPYVREQHIEPCPPASGETWQAALDTLAKLLSREKWQNADAIMTLSNHFVRYLLIPWNTEINGEQEQNAYVKHRFSKVFGPAANNWILHHSQTAIGMPRLASGINQTLLEGIRQACVTNKLRLRSVQPYLMPAFNQYRRIFQNESAWFVLVEHDKLTIAQLGRQSWQLISTHLISNENLAAELPVLLERHLCLSGIKNQPSQVFLLAPEHPQLVLPRNNDWVIQQLQPVPRFGLPIQTYALVMGEH